ncbi:hypothetical protein, partial [Pseudomonas avellanae]|uniref:hypothetical protein n=1 Tax=Pseudomonas avellanae TaxID=46257 RepID=UPI001CA56F05
NNALHAQGVSRHAFLPVHSLMTPSKLKRIGHEIGAKPIGVKKGKEISIHNPPNRPLLCTTPLIMSR